MSRPKLLIEQWLPIEAIGAECMRERGASSALPPLYFLHVWWARRPLTVSRAAILASLLPAYPTEDNPDTRPLPDRFRTLFPNFDAYKAWFVRLIGILGDPVAGKKLIEWAKKENKKLNFNPYGYTRAFTINPSEEHLEQLYDLLEWTWGSREITFCDPMSGGGSIPFEALRYGLTVHANELNPVASVILKATLDYPARFGPSLVEDIKKYGKIWSDLVRDRLEPYFPLTRSDENIFCYLWAVPSHALRPGSRCRCHQTGGCGRAQTQWRSVWSLIPKQITVAFRSSEARRGARKQTRTRAPSNVALE